MHLCVGWGCVQVAHTQMGAKGQLQMFFQVVGLFFDTVCMRCRSALAPRTENIFVKSVLPFPLYLCSENGRQVPRLAQQAPLPLSHLAAPFYLGVLRQHLSLASSIYWFGSSELTGPVGPKNPTVSASLVPRLQVCTTMPGSLFGC